MNKSVSYYRKSLKLLIVVIFLVLPGAGISLTFAQTVKSPVKDTIANCGCPAINFSKPLPRYYPPLSEYISYKTLDAVTGWKLAGGKSSFDMIFTSGNAFSTGGSSFWTDKGLISPRDPIKIIHPDKTFTVNLTPCPNEYHDYVTEANVTCNLSPVSRLQDFDFSKFENTTFGYVHLFLQLAHVRPDQIITIAIKNEARNSGPEWLNRSITKINDAYKTGLPLATENNYNTPEIISTILDALVAKKLRQELVLTTGFILSQPGVHPPTYDEQYSIKELFNQYCDYHDFDLFDMRKFLPDFNIGIYSHHAVVEISSNVIAAKSKEKNLPAYTGLWVDFSHAEFSSQSMLEISIRHVCMPPSVIAGSSVDIDFEQAGLYSDPTQTSREFDFNQYPQFIKNGEAKNDKGVRPNPNNYDTLLNRFSGVFAKDVRFKIPNGKTQLLIKGQNVILNNRVIAGCMMVELEPDKTGKALLNQANGAGKTMAIADLLLVLKKAGLNDFITKTDKKQLLVYFKKTAG